MVTQMQFRMQDLPPLSAPWLCAGTPLLCCLKGTTHWDLIHPSIPPFSPRDLMEVGAGPGSVITGWLLCWEGEAAVPAARARHQGRIVCWSPVASSIAIANSRGSLVPADLAAGGEPEGENTSFCCDGGIWWL